MCRLNFPQGCLTEHRSLGAVGDGWPMMVPFTQRGASLVRLGEIAMILELHRQGVSVSAIARQVGLDRKTVHKYIERGLEPPMYGPRPPRASKIAPFSRYLRERLAAFPQLTGRRLHRELRELGYTGGYSILTNFLRDIRPTEPAVRGALRDAARPSGTGRFRPLPHGVHRRAGDGEDPLVVLARAGPQSHAVGPLRAAPGPADTAALSGRRVRGVRRCARTHPLRPHAHRVQPRGS